jgi:glucose-6-phosphate 1-dehydrogenase
LNEEIHKVLDESDVYRIDHYLGKETVQNILAFRFGNGIFEPLWNRRYVDNVQITAAESIGVEGRGGYYQEAGALRDMIQNHLSQVMATVAMEPPTVFDAANVRDERAKLLRAVRVVKADDVSKYAVAGQYGPANVGGQNLVGFRQEPSVDPNAQTDTYAAVTFFIDNWRWADVPFYIRTGKRMPKRVTDIAIQFHAPPLGLFSQETKGGLREARPNLLVLRIQPEEGISLRFLSKSPGSGMRVRPVSMDFNYGSSFGERTPTAYETLLVDAMAGDATLYTRQDMVDASWQIVQPILDVWGKRNLIFRITRPARGGRKRLTKCWRAKGTSGGCHEQHHYFPRSARTDSEGPGQIMDIARRRRKASGTAHRFARLRYDADCGHRRTGCWFCRLANYFRTHARASGARHCAGGFTRR